MEGYMMKSRYFPVVFDRFSAPAVSLFQGMQGLAERMGALPFLDVDAGLNVHVDFYRHDGKLFVEAELPGVRPEDVELNVCADKLTLSAEKSAEKKEGGEDKSYFRSERSWGKVERVISFPVEADPDSAKATFKDGVLTIEVDEKQKDRAHKKVAITSGD